MVITWLLTMEEGTVGLEHLYMRLEIITKKHGTNIFIIDK